MPMYKTTGLVLSRNNFGEADRIICFLTPDYGKVRAVARGVRKIKSRLAGHLELFSVAELMLARGKGLDVLAGARLICHHDRLSRDWDSLTLGYLITEMLDKLVEEGMAQPRLFKTARDFLFYLDQEGASPQLELAFKLRLLDDLGYRPRLDYCLSCSRVTKNCYFDPSLGGVVCPGCAQSRPYHLSSPVLALWRAIQSGELKSDNETSRLAASSLPACDAFVEHTFGRRFRSQEMLARL